MWVAEEVTESRAKAKQAALFPLRLLAHIQCHYAAEWVVSHLHVEKLGGTTGDHDRPYNTGFQCGEIKPQNL